MDHGSKAEIDHIEHELMILRSRLANMQRSGGRTRIAYILFAISLVGVALALMYKDFVAGLVALFGLGILIGALWLLSVQYSRFRWVDGATSVSVSEYRNFLQSRRSYTAQVEEWIETRENRLAELKGRVHGSIA